MPPVKPKNAKRKKIRRKKRPSPKSSPTDVPPRSAQLQAPEPPASAEPSPHFLAATELADQLHSTAIHLLRRLRVRDRETNVGPAQLSALSVLVFGGPKSLGELADAEQVRPPTMSRIVAGLQRARLVRRHATEDGRRIRLEATPGGVSLMWEARKRRVQSLAKVVTALRENERQQLHETLALLQRVIKNL
jgi:DNA-binding MarR family transcriptional regulator